MIREERDPAFWLRVAQHPEVAPRISMGRPDWLDLLAMFVEHPSVTPLASEHGGFLFQQLDPLGRVYEWHAMFTPEGWGREALDSAHEALTLVFGRGAQAVLSSEIDGWWRSRPPLSFGWVALGDFAPAPEHAVDVRTWLLTRKAWETSPARRRRFAASRSSSRNWRRRNHHWQLDAVERRKEGG